MIKVIVNGDVDLKKKFLYISNVLNIINIYVVNRMYLYFSH